MENKLRPCHHCGEPAEKRYEELKKRSLVFFSKCVTSDWKAINSRLRKLERTRNAIRAPSMRH